MKNKQPLDLTDIKISQPDEAYATTPIYDPICILLGLAKRGQNRGNKRQPTICKVPRILRNLSELSFSPQLVSIGPIHREDRILQEFEWLKECYLNDLLSRCDDYTPHETLEACVVRVNKVMDDIRKSYAGMIEKYSDHQVTTMMVMDGCFILEFCLKHKYEHSDFPNKMQNNRIAMDLLLLENQVPFFVLQALFDSTMGKASFTLSNVLDAYLAPYIKIFRSDFLLPETTIHFDSDSTHVHVLGYLHKHYQLVVTKPSNPIHALKPKLVASKSLNPIRSLISKLVAAKSLNPIRALKSKLVAAKSLNPIRALISKLADKKGSKNTHIAVHSILELDRSGINFKPHQEGGWSMTMKFQSSLFAYLPGFWSEPTLLMPTLVIDNDTEQILRNFIAYEQSFPQEGYYFTSYAYAMDMLIDTEEDMAKLVESKVLVNMLKSYQEAKDMINKICQNIFVTDFYYAQEFKEIDRYYNSYWPNNIARLRRIYWSATALVAAIILFFLSVVQTIYAIKGK